MRLKYHSNQWFANPQTSIIGITGDLLEMQIFRPHFRSTKLETLGIRPSNWFCFVRMYVFLRFIYLFEGEGEREHLQEGEGLREREKESQTTSG